MTVGYKKLNMSKLNDRKRQIISSSDALKEITPINWSKEIQDGKKSVTVENYEIFFCKFNKNILLLT